MSARSRTARAGRRARRRAAGVCTLTVPLGARSYDVHLAFDWAPLAGMLSALELGRRLLLVTDEVVAPLYARPVRRQLEGAGFNVGTVSLGSGERLKTLGQVARIYDTALDHGLTREDAIVALGGGVAGDLAGFVAATLFRGIRWVQVPTTLLAMVDASIGGKTAVNLKRGKNLVGAFHQPSLVFANLRTLDSLPPRQLRAGVAEIIKCGMIRDAGLVRHLERHVHGVLELVPEALAEAIMRAIAVKKRIVGADERERGVRLLLNYGHTIGHGIEVATGYRRFLHGEAVALGMLAAARLGVELGVTPVATSERQRQLIAESRLPLRPRGVPVAGVMRALRFDKKATDAGLRFVLTSRVGSASVHCQLRTAMIERAICEVTSS